MGMSIRCIINEDGLPFDFAELQTISRQLDSFSDDKRIVYRNQNFHRNLIVENIQDP